MDGLLNLSLQSYDSDEELLSEVLESSSFQSTTVSTEPPIDSCEDQQITIEEDDFLIRIARLTGMTGVTKESVEELNSAYEYMKNARKKFTQEQVIMDAVHEVASSNSKLPTQTKQQVCEVLEFINMEDFVVPCAGHSEMKEDSCKVKNSGVVGLTKDALCQAYITELPPSDVKALKIAIESQLNLKRNHMTKLDKHAKDTTSVVSRPSGNNPNNLIEPKHTCEILKLKNEIQQEQRVHQSLLVELDATLGSLVKLKSIAFPSAAAEMCLNVEKKAALLIQQLKAVNIDIVKESYTEDPVFIEAYKKLKKILQCALEEAKAQLSNLNDKEGKYMELKGTEYDNLLKEYKNLKKDLDQKKHALTFL